MSSEQSDHKRQWATIKLRAEHDPWKISFWRCQMKIELQFLRKWSMYANMVNQSEQVRRIKGEK